MPSATIHLYARMLREGGYIATGGRGRSARQVTIEDASALCLALLGTTGASGAVPALDLFKTMRIKDGQSANLLGFLVDLPRGSSAIDAMNMLLELIRSGELQEIHSSAGDDDASLMQSIAVRFRLSGGRPALAFSVASHGAWRSENVNFEEPTEMKAGGLETVVKISGETLAAVALAFREPISSPEQPQ